MRISDWSSDVCSSDLMTKSVKSTAGSILEPVSRPEHPEDHAERSEEHTSELQSLMRISYAVFCLKKKIILRTTSDRMITLLKSNHTDTTCRPTYTGPNKNIEHIN